METLSIVGNSGEGSSSKEAGYSHESDSDNESLMDCSMIEKTFTEDYLNQLHASMMSVDDAFDEDSDDENTIVLNFDKETPNTCDNSSSDKKEESSPKPLSKTTNTKNVRPRSPVCTKNITPNKRRKKDLQPPPKLKEANRDIFCWRCHKYGEAVISCNVCPRVFHLKCSHLPENPGKEWICTECDAIRTAEISMSRDSATKGLTPERLSHLLEFAIRRMRQHEGSSHFENLVDPLEYPDYKDYIVKPVYLTLLETNVKNKVYTNCEAFLGDAKWMLHNSYIFNSGNSELTHFARVMLKHGKHECDEILNCPDCYLHANTLDEDKWFIEPCELPHILVWAKLKGWPFWPCKVMKTSGNKDVDVRFFGDHNKAIVPVDNCYLYSKQMPSKMKKFPDLEAAIRECLLHIAKLDQKFGEFHYAPVKVMFNPKQEAEQRRVLLPYVIEGVPIEEALKRRPKIRNEDCKVTIVLSGARDRQLNWNGIPRNFNNRGGSVSRPIGTNNAVFQGTPYKHPILSKRLLLNTTQCGNSAIIIHDDSDDDVREISFKTDSLGAKSTNTHSFPIQSKKEMCPPFLSNANSSSTANNTNSSKGFFLSQFNLTRTPQSIKVGDNCNAPKVQEISEVEKKKKEDDERLSVLGPIKNSIKTLKISPPKKMSKTSHISKTDFVIELNPISFKPTVPENNGNLSESSRNLNGEQKTMSTSDSTISQKVQTPKEDCVAAAKKVNSSTEVSLIESTYMTKDNHEIIVPPLFQGKQSGIILKPRILLEKLSDSVITEHGIVIEKYIKKDKLTAQKSAPKSSLNLNLLDGNINDIVPISQVDLNSDEADEDTPKEKESNGHCELEMGLIKEEEESSVDEIETEPVDESVIQLLAKSYSSVNEENINSKSKRSDSRENETLRSTLEVQSSEKSLLIQNDSNSSQNFENHTPSRKINKVPFSSICNSDLLQKYIEKILSKKSSSECTLGADNNEMFPEKQISSSTSINNEDLAGALATSPGDKEMLSCNQSSYLNNKTFPEKQPSLVNSDVINGTDPIKLPSLITSTVNNEMLPEKQLSLASSLPKEPVDNSTKSGAESRPNEKEILAKGDSPTEKSVELEISEHSFHSSDDEDISDSEAYGNEMYGIRKMSQSLSDVTSESSMESMELDDVDAQEQHLAAKIIRRQKYPIVKTKDSTVNTDEVWEPQAQYDSSDGENNEDGSFASKCAYDSAEAEDNEANEKHSDEGTFKTPEIPEDHIAELYGVGVADAKERNLFQGDDYSLEEVFGSLHDVNNILESYKMFHCKTYSRQSYGKSNISNLDAKDAQAVAENNFALSNLKVFSWTNNKSPLSEGNKAEDVYINKSNNKQKERARREEKGDKLEEDEEEEGDVAEDNEDDIEAESDMNEDDEESESCMIEEGESDMNEDDEEAESGMIEDDKEAESDMVEDDNEEESNMVEEDKDTDEEDEDKEADEDEENVYVKEDRAVQTDVMNNDQHSNDERMRNETSKLVNKGLDQEELSDVPDNIAVDPKAKDVALGEATISRKIDGSESPSSQIKSKQLDSHDSNQNTTRSTDLAQSVADNISQLPSEERSVQQRQLISQHKSPNIQEGNTSNESKHSGNFSLIEEDIDTLDKSDETTNSNKLSKDNLRNSNFDDDRQSEESDMDDDNAMITEHGEVERNIPDEEGVSDEDTEDETTVAKEGLSKIVERPEMMDIDDDSNMEIQESIESNEQELSEIEEPEVIKPEEKELGKSKVQESKEPVKRKLCIAEEHLNESIEQEIAEGEFEEVNEPEELEIDEKDADEEEINEKDADEEEINEKDADEEEINEKDADKIESNEKEAGVTEPEEFEINEEDAEVHEQNELEIDEGAEEEVDINEREAEESSELKINEEDAEISEPEEAEELIEPEEEELNIPKQLPPIYQYKPKQPKQQAFNLRKLQELHKSKQDAINETKARKRALLESEEPGSFKRQGNIFIDVINTGMFHKELKDCYRAIEKVVPQPEVASFLQNKFKEFECKIIDKIQDCQRDCVEEMDALCTLERERWKQSVKDVYSDEMNMMIEEIKKKQWCVLCLREAKFHCCWSTSYCSEKCQVADWPVHVKDCTQYKMRAGDPDLRLSPAYKDLVSKKLSKKTKIGEIIGTIGEKEHSQHNRDESGSTRPTFGIETKPKETIKKNLFSFNPRSNVQGKAFIHFSNEGPTKGQTVIKFVNNKPSESDGSSSKTFLVKAPVQLSNDGRTLVSVGQTLPPKSLSKYTIAGSKKSAMVLLGNNKILLPTSLPSAKQITSSSLPSSSNATAESWKHPAFPTQNKTNVLYSSSLLTGSKASLPSSKQKKILVIDKVLPTGAQFKVSSAESSNTATCQLSSVVKDISKHS